MSGVALVVFAEDPEVSLRPVLEAAIQGLSGRHSVEVLDLVAAGFAPAMSREERQAYHGPAPILDPLVSEYAAKVVEAETLVFVYATRWWGPPPILKAWLERVLVPGVSFVLDDEHKVRPNLTRLRSIAGVTVHTQSRETLKWAGDGGRKILLRALRLNASRRVKTRWFETHHQTDARFTSKVEQGMERM